MTYRKVKRYIVAYDEDGDVLVWGLHADLTVRLMALHEGDLTDQTEIPILDLRDADQGRS